jgi:outer membrane protein assembly factor BamB
MRRRLTWAGGVLLGVALALTGPLAHGVITRLLPLGGVLKEMQYICVARVEKLDPDRPAMILTVAEDLKGKLPFRRLPVNLKGDTGARKAKEVPQLLKRLAPDLPLVLFANHEPGKQVTVFAYTNGTWFQMTGEPAAGKADAVVLGFTHCEPYLRRTFKGTTDQMRQAVADGLSGKRPPPGPNPQEAPGLGPEIPPGKAGRTKIQEPRTQPLALGSWFLDLGSFRRAGGPLFAVIPTLGIGGPIALLALLFPSLFGGVLVLFRRWAAFFAILSVNSTLFLLHGWFAADLWGSWWGSPATLWLAMTLITLLGVLWAWRRHLTFFQQGQPEAPARTEHIVLWLLSLGCGVTLFFYWLDLRSGSDPTWRLLLVLAAGVGAGTLYKLYRGLLGSRLTKAPLPTEGIILLASLALFVTFAARPARLALGGEAAEGQERKAWGVLFSDKGSGMLVSSPCIAGDRAFVSVAHSKGLQTFGAVYCLDLGTRKIVWSFDDDGKMKQAYSSPCVADGRLYVGEGFHDDADCKIYCIDAKTGKRVWSFQTASQTESSPCVVGGKVFCGAGNDGVYALDAVTGKKLWQYPVKQDPAAPLRVGASPVVVGKRLYVGSGVDRNHPDNPGETAVFCLDADTGKLVWKVKTDLPSWGAPAAAGGQVFFGLGNGDIFTDATKPAGAMLCLDAGTGKQQWRTDVPNGVLERPAVDRGGVYFGARDGCCYCLNRRDGKRRWKRDLGSPVLTTPALDVDAPEGAATSLIIIPTHGPVACLAPATGKVLWSWEELDSTDNHLISSPRVVVQAGGEGRRRRIYFGATLNNLSLPALYCVEDVPPR